jgi:hypothetical protein
MNNYDNSNVECLQDDSGACIIETDPRIFLYIVEYLRTGNLSAISEEDRRQLIKDAKHYKVDGLVKALENGVHPIDDVCLLGVFEA